VREVSEPARRVQRRERRDEKGGTNKEEGSIGGQELMHEWQRVWAKVYQALRDFPEALKAVAAALEPEGASP
jgi:hypothetical protein